MDALLPDPVDRRDFLRRSCGLFTAVVLAANGAALAGCDTLSGGGVGVSSDPTGVSVSGSSVTVDLAQASALDAVGGALLVSSARVLVVHVGADDYRAFDSVCPHEQNTIREVVSSGGTVELRCPSHGWTFDLNGQPTGRAQRPTPRYPVVQEGGVLTITLA